MNTTDPLARPVPETPPAPPAGQPATAVANPQSAAPRPPKTPAPVTRYERVPWKRIGLFVLIAYALFAVAAAPFWFLPGGIKHPLFTIVIGAGMWAPAIASLIVSKAVERTSWRTRVGLRFRGRWKQLLIWTPAAAVLIVAIAVLTFVLSALRGVPADLTGRTWLATGLQQIADQTGKEMPALVLIISFVVIGLFSLLTTSVLTLGEEIGWRGWLWPALKPLGRIPAAIIGGVIWSLWHLPIILIGYNYPGQNRAAAVAMFIVPCAAMFLLFGALTDRVGGNPLPATLGHAAVNSLSSMVIGLFATSATMESFNHFLDGPLGLVGAVLMTLAGLALMPWRRRPDLPELDPGQPRDAVRSADERDADVTGPGAPAAPVMMG